jgi:hypothetical protein
MVDQCGLFFCRTPRAGARRRSTLNRKKTMNDQNETESTGGPDGVSFSASSCSAFQRVLDTDATVRAMVDRGATLQDVVVYLAGEKEKLRVASEALYSIADERNLSLALPAEVVKLLQGVAKSALRKLWELREADPKGVVSVRDLLGLDRRATDWSVFSILASSDKEGGNPSQNVEECHAANYVRSTPAASRRWHLRFVRPAG